MGQTKIFEVTQNVPTTQYRDENIFLCENILKYFFVESDTKKCTFKLYISYYKIVDTFLIIRYYNIVWVHYFQKCDKV